jgi:DNA-binding SARP family transcriptional activator
LERRYVAGSLWPRGDDTRAAGNLRSALWRLRCAGIDVIESDKWSLWLADGVAVDLDEIVLWSDRVLSGSPDEHDFHRISDKIPALDILPGCYDDWVINERERIRQRILHALEQLSRQLSHRGRFAEAVEAAMAAVCCEPLRESAQRTLIESHLAEGNLCEARRVFTLYTRLITQELGVEPSPELRALVRLPKTIPALHL